MPSAARHWARALTTVAGLEADRRTLPERLGDLAERFGPRPALICAAGTLTYAGLRDRADHYTSWAVNIGLQPGDVVALMVSGCSEYAAIWLGITRAGGVVALVNTEIRAAALAHALEVAAPRHIIAETALTPAFGPAAPDAGLWTFGPAPPGWQRVDTIAVPHGAAPVASPALGAPALLIYTSGTTGRPKAVTISHGRILEWSLWFAGMMDVTPDDRMYDCLPLHHSIGGVVAIGAMLVQGGSVLIRPRFSTRQFWDDVAEGGCTIVQYIGELCRYLADSPPHPRERDHRLRLACGNGLRAELWPVLAERFQIPRVLEYYAATEGSVTLYNVEQRPGAVGRVPPFLAHRFPVALLRYDHERGEPFRDESGRCIPCAVDEAGEAIGPVPAQGLYTDAAASASKLLRDVFVTGDCWFRTGDLLRRDRDGFFWFVDRIGDTFRWKGENVSTTEVGDTLAGCPGVLAACVYGVAVPGCEGKAGMAALVVDHRFTPAAFYAHAAAHLAAFAWPVFVRLCPQIASTQTFKPMKAALAQQGFDPARVPDPLLVLDRAARSYVALDASRLAQITRGELRM